MASTQPVVAVPAVEAADDPAVVAELVGLINNAYSTAERGMWTQDLPRTTPDEVAVAITGGELGALRLDGRFVGSVFVRLLDPRTGWFGALAVDPAHGGQRARPATGRLRRAARPWRRCRRDPARAARAGDRTPSHRAPCPVVRRSRLSPHRGSRSRRDRPRIGGVRSRPDPRLGDAQVVGRSDVTDGDTSC